MRRWIANAVQFVLGCYVFSAMLSVLYYNWRYSRQHGFLDWLFLGELTATGKGLAWPYFAFGEYQRPTWTEEEKDNASHFFTSSDLSIQATRLRNQGRPYSQVSPDTRNSILRLQKIALVEARLVRDDVLDKALPGMSKPFREQYQRGLELQIQALERADGNAEIEGSALHDKWVDWINARRVHVPE